MKITGDDELGKAQLDNFINPKKAYPVIATTSELMSTGVDAKTCKLVVLDQNIQSMTKFKQIIGRGTRIDDRYGKLWFTILDFKKATELFADERFDGTPEKIIRVTPEDIEDENVDIDSVGDEVTNENGADDNQNQQGDEHQDDEHINEPQGDGLDNDKWDEGEWDEGETRKIHKYRVSGVTVSKVAERVQYYDSDGKLVTESFKDYTRKTMAKQFSSLDEFVKRWNESDRKQAVIDELALEGIIWSALEEEVGKDMDPFDMICHVVYDQPPLTRKDRANNVQKRNYFTKYSDTAQAVLQNLLVKYADVGVQEIENMQVLKVAPFTEYGNLSEIVKKGFGGKQEYDQAISELEAQIYQIHQQSA
jgi:type I restriction enzyme R subunit